VGVGAAIRAQAEVEIVVPVTLTAGIVGIGQTRTIQRGRRPLPTVGSTGFIRTAAAGVVIGFVRIGNGGFMVRGTGPAMIRSIGFTGIAVAGDVICAIRLGNGELMVGGIGPTTVAGGRRR
jgi:hypothetical protein